MHHENEGFANLIILLVFAGMQSILMCIGSVYHEWILRFIIACLLCMLLMLIRNAIQWPQRNHALNNIKCGKNNTDFHMVYFTAMK